MKLISLTLENFEGTKRFEFCPDGRSVTVKAANGVGKSTLMDAYWWLLTGKNSAQTEKFDIYPVGAPEDVQVSVTGVFQTDGGETLALGRTYKRNIGRRRGDAESTVRGFDKLSGIPDISGKRISDTVVGYFAYFRLLNGHEHVYYMSRPDMEKYAERYSPSYSSKYSPWKTDFDKMAMKTVLRQLLGKWGPTSTEMQTVEKYDDKGSTPVQEMQEKANRTVIDVQVDESTGEVINPEALPAQDVKPEKEPASQEAFDPGF